MMGVFIGSFIGLIVVKLIVGGLIKLSRKSVDKKHVFVFTVEELFYVLIVAVIGAVGLAGYVFLQLWKQTY